MREGVAPITAEEAQPPPPRAPKELLHEMKHGIEYATKIQARREFDEQLADSNLSVREFFEEHGMTPDDEEAYVGMRRAIYGY